MFWSQIQRFVFCFHFQLIKKTLIIIEMTGAETNYRTVWCLCSVIWSSTLSFALCTQWKPWWSLIMRLSRTMSWAWRRVTSSWTYGEMKEDGGRASWVDAGGCSPITLSGWVTANSPCHLDVFFPHPERLWKPTWDPPPIAAEQTCSCGGFWVFVCVAIFGQLNTHSTFLQHYTLCKVK